MFLFWGIVVIAVFIPALLFLLLVHFEVQMITDANASLFRWGVPEKFSTETVNCGDSKWNVLLFFAPPINWVFIGWIAYWLIKTSVLKRRWLKEARIKPDQDAI